MICDRSIRYENGEQFFKLNGHAIMPLSVVAAIHVCQIAYSKGYIVSRVEGGIWHDPGFESRLDCIWDRNHKLDNKPEKANKEAERFISGESEKHDVFIITVQSIK